MIINHYCAECDIHMNTIVIDGKVWCLHCGTGNDVWLEEEEPPENHRVIDI